MNLIDRVVDQGRLKSYGVTALMAVLVFSGAAAARDALQPASDVQPADQTSSDVFVTPSDTPAATATEAPAPVVTPAPAPAPQPVVTKAPSIQGVTEPAPKAPAADAAPVVPTKSYDPAAPWVDGQSGKTFIPAPPVPMEPIPGERQLPNDPPPAGTPAG